MRALLVVIDSFGIGALPDAEQYGDLGANTALHICEAVENVQWPALQKLGLGNCSAILGNNLPGCEPVPQPQASHGVMVEASRGKDTTTGHWELAGVVLEKPFTTFSQQYPSFPPQLIRSIIEQTGYEVLGNKGASGTKIIEELGADHLAGKGIIIYTSADSVMQIAAHEQVVPIDELYSICSTARKLCNPYNVGRVIARPFAGSEGSFVRTLNRKDFSMLPPEDTILDILQENKVETVSIGKIGDIFSERGIVKSYHDHGNDACMDRLIAGLKTPAKKREFVFVNLIDTDMLYGHRRDIVGYHDAIKRVDLRIPEIVSLMSKEDVLIITADHGCDPGFQGSDHTREYVPLLVYQKGQAAKNLGIRGCFCDVAQSLASYFKVVSIKRGVSFLT